MEAKRTNGTTAVLNIGGNKNEGMQLLTAQNLKDYVGEKDYALDQNVKALESALKQYALDNVSIKDGKLVQ